MIIILMAIGEYFIGGYGWLLMLLYQWLSMAIMLMVINVIILVVIGGYYINGYWWLLLVILLMVIVF